MKFRDYFLNLSAEGRDAYAQRAGTSVAYVQIHLMASPPRKIPRPDLLRSLAEATEGGCSFQEMLEHFYPDAPEPAEPEPASRRKRGAA